MPRQPNRKGTYRSKPNVSAATTNSAESSELVALMYIMYPFMAIGGVMSSARPG